MHQRGMLFAVFVSALWAGGCRTQVSQPERESRLSSLNADLGNDYTGNYLWVHGTRSIAVDAKYPCLNEVAACLSLDASGRSPAVMDLCPSADTPEGTWTFEYALHTDQDCTQPLGNVNCVIDQGTTLAPGENHRNVRCMTSNAITDFKVCLYDPVTGAGFGSCNPVSCVFVNDNAKYNFVTAYKVDGSTGSLTEVGTFETGGNGFEGWKYPWPPPAISVLGTFVYASNVGSGSISAFALDPWTCALTPVDGSPFDAGSSIAWTISLAPTPDGKFLYAATGDFLYAYAIAPNGVLKPLDRYPYADAPPSQGLKVSPDGRFLAMAAWDAGVRMFRIDPEGALEEVPGSPFPVDPRFFASGVDIDCASSLVFVAEWGFGSPPLVEVFAIGADGSLTPSGGDGYLFQGTSSALSVAVLSADDQALFVADGTDGVAVATVGAGGALTEVKGSPFKASSDPLALATDAGGQFLYGVGWIKGAQLLGFQIGDGMLAPVDGSPYLIKSTEPGSLAVFPPKSCSRR